MIKTKGVFWLEAINQLKVIFIVIIIAKNDIFIVASSHNMIKTFREDNPGLSWHNLILHPRGLND